jgi:hypothetical protein
MRAATFAPVLPRFAPLDDVLEPAVVEDLAVVVVFTEAVVLGAVVAVVVGLDELELQPTATRSPMVRQRRLNIRKLR